jgi:hypothetical protein
MNPASGLIIDPSIAPEAPTPRRERRYTPGFADGLGDRLLTYDPATTTSLELLRFKREFSESPAFEAALRERVDQLKHVRHPSLATVLAVEHLEPEAGGCLALVSKHTAGRRLSELLSKARGPVFALEFLRQVTPVLAALQQPGDGIAHGTLTAERIVVTREGPLVLVEHVVSSALEALRLPASRLRADFGLVIPAGYDAVRLDCRADVIQLGFVALSLLLGRRLDAADSPANLPALLDEFAAIEVSASSNKLRLWLERALQLGARPFATAQEAQYALHELPGKVDPQPADAPRTLLPFQPPAPSPAPPPVPAAPRPQADAAADVWSEPPAASRPFVMRLQPLAAGSAAQASAVPPPPAPPAPVRRKRVGRWGAGITAIAVVGGLVFAAIVWKPWKTSPANTVTEAPPTSAVEPAKPAIPPAMWPAGVTTTAPPPAAVTTPPASPPAPAPAPVQKPAAALPATPPDAAPADRAAVAAASKFGGIKITSPIELQAFEGGTLVGSTAGQIALAEGSHTLDLVNEGLGFRSQVTVRVKGGQLTPVTVGVPNGRISINAVPWANVWIDGNPAGETPLANLALPIGQHEILFRHPQLGEQRQTVVVKTEGLTRASVTFQRGDR